MPGFRFRLEKVLHWYEEQCRLEEMRLGHHLAAVAEAQAAVARLQAERVRIERELLGRRALSGCDLAAWGRYRLRAKNEEAALTAERERREAAAAEQRGRVVAARRRVRLLDKLRERRLAEYTVEADRELEKLASEGYLSQWSRK